MIDDLPERTSTLVASYLTIRRAVGWSGLALPVTLLVGGWIAGVPVQDNMSSYYHTAILLFDAGSLFPVSFSS